MRELISSVYHLFYSPRNLIASSLKNSNMLTLVPDGEQPRSLLVGPKLSYMDERIVAIDLVIKKLVRCSLFPFTTPV